jgi:hypothetical protein
LSILKKLFQKNHFLKIFKLLTSYAAETKFFEFLKIFFSKKKIISQFSFLDIFKNVHFTNFDPDFILGVFKDFFENPFELEIPRFFVKKAPTTL